MSSQSDLGALFTQEQNSLLKKCIRIAREAFLGGKIGKLTHDMNNSLGAMQIHLELCIDACESGETVKSDEIKDSLKVLNSCVERLGREVVEIRSAIRPERKGELQEIDMNDLVRETMQSFESRFLIQKVKVELKLQPGLPKVWAISSDFEQLLTNLISNADRAMTAARNIDSTAGNLLIIRTQSSEDGVTIAVKDSGIGISAHEQERIFEPKSGLGLVITESIVQEYKGKIKILSQPGQGAEFTVWFPINCRDKTSAMEGAA